MLEFPFRLSFRLEELDCRTYMAELVQDAKILDRNISRVDSLILKKNEPYYIVTRERNFIL